MRRTLEFVLLAFFVLFVTVGIAVRVGLIERDSPAAVNCGPEGKRVPTTSGEWACIDREPVYLVRP